MVTDGLFKYEYLPAPALKINIWNEEMGSCTGKLSIIGNFLAANQ